MRVRCSAAIGTVRAKPLQLAVPRLFALGGRSQGSWSIGAAILRMDALERSRPRSAKAGLPQLYRGRAASSFKDLYETDHAESRQGGRFRWLISTCLAGTVGAISIFVVIYGSADKRESRGGFLPGLTELGEANLAGRDMPFVRTQRGPQMGGAEERPAARSPAAPSPCATSSTSRVKQRRLGREYIHAKPYVRIVARLAPVPADYQRRFRRSIRSTSTPRRRSTAGEDSEADDAGARQRQRQRHRAARRHPARRGRSGARRRRDRRSTSTRRKEAEVEAEIDPRRRRGGRATAPAGDDGLPLGAERRTARRPNTTVLVKPTQDDEDTLADLEGRETQVVNVGDRRHAAQDPARAPAPTPGRRAA